MLSHLGLLPLPSGRGTRWEKGHSHALHKYTVAFDPRSYVLRPVLSDSLLAITADEKGTLAALPPAFDKLSRTRGLASALLAFIGAVAPER